MNPKNKSDDKEYEVGSSTSSASYSSTSEQKIESASDDLDIDTKKYSKGKPKRIIIRAIITHD